MSNARRTNDFDRDRIARNPRPTLDFDYVTAMEKFRDYVHPDDFRRWRREFRYVAENDWWQESPGEYYSSYPLHDFLKCADRLQRLPVIQPARQDELAQLDAALHYRHDFKVAGGEDWRLQDWYVLARKKYSTTPEALITLVCESGAGFAPDRHWFALLQAYEFSGDMNKGVLNKGIRNAVLDVEFVPCPAHMIIGKMRHVDDIEAEEKELEP